MFHQEAMDISLLERDWDEALRHADVLDKFTAAEPLGTINLATARARALVALGRDGPSPECLAQVRRLRTRILEAGLKPLLRGLDGVYEG